MSSVPVKTIAGHNAGIRVTIRYDLYPLFEGLEKAAKGGSHWASICVKQLSSLSSGHIKKGVHVQGNGSQEEAGEYSIILPGCRASFRKNNSGVFFIYALETDANYGDLQDAEKRSGLFNVKKGKQGWSTILTPHGQIQERKNNVVAVSDQFTRVSFAALLAPEAIADSGQASESALVSNGFDLHFTPGKNRIGGLRNIGQSYRAETDSALHESALLLASTMESAKKMKDVTWVSERGGSGVLTQAMRILRDKRVSFKDSGHKAFFSKLQTNLGSAEQLACEIGLTFDGKSHSKELINVNQLVGSGLFGGFVNPIRRYRIDDKYSALNMLSDIKTEGFAHKEAVGAVMGTGAVLAGVQASAVGLGTALASLSAPGLVFGAVVATATATAALYKGATAVTKSYFPLASHKKLIGK